MDNNNFAVAELNGDYDNFFDFEAASCNTPPAQQAHTVDDGKWNHIMPLTEPEIEYVLAMRASNAQNPDPSYSLAPAELNTNIVGFEGPSAHGAWFNYDGAGIPSLANLSNFDMADYGNSLPNKQPHFKEPGDVLGALNNFAPNPTDQLE
jgi:hypothetical protein